MADDTINDMTTEQLWAAAYDRAVELVSLLHPDQRGQSTLGLPYWMAVGMKVGIITSTTHELSKRSS